MRRRSYLFLCIGLLPVTLLSHHTALAQCPGIENYQPLESEPPAYPRRARNRGITGYAVVDFVIAETGEITEPKITDAKPTRIFDRSVVNAVKKYRYPPCIVDGQAMQIEHQLKFNFSLE